MGEHSDLIKQIILFLNQSGHFVWKNQTGAYKRNGVWIKYGKLGSGDVIGMLKTGKFISVECKKGKDKHRRQQKNFEYLTKRMNGVYIICKTFKEFLKEYAKQ